MGLLLAGLALAASPSSGDASPPLPPSTDQVHVSRRVLAPDPRRNVRESAHVLDQGELLLGTDGVAVGVLPAVQLSTQALLDSVGWFNGAAKVEALRSPVLSLAVQGGGGGAQWGEMRGRHVDLGATASFTFSKALSMHVGPRYAVLSMEGVPTEPPPAVAEWVPMTALWGAADNSAAVGLVPRIYARHTEVRGAAEVRLNRRDSLVVSGAWTVWGQNGTDLLNRVPGMEPLDPIAQGAVDWAEGLGRAGHRRVALSYRIAFGNADVRLGAGLSDLAGVWAADANGVNLRAFGEARREDRRLLAEARGGEEEDESVASATTTADGSAAALP